MNFMVIAAPAQTGFAAFSDTFLMRFRVFEIKKNTFLAFPYRVTAAEYNKVI